MRATDIEHKDKEQPAGLMRLQQGAEMCRQYIAHIPRWRKPVIGYVLTFPTVALATVFVMLMKYYLPRFYFPGATMLLAIVLVALLWGIGPALLSVILCTLSLDYLEWPDTNFAILLDRYSDRHHLWSARSCAQACSLCGTCA